MHASENPKQHNEKLSSQSATVIAPHAVANDVGFIHLRVHTAYSMLEGTLRAQDLVNYCKKYRVPAVAITDSNGLFGIPEMSAALEQAGVKPLLGLEAQLEFDDIAQNRRSAQETQTRTAPLVFFAMNEKGYANLMRLASAIYRIEQNDDKQAVENTHASINDNSQTNSQPSTQAIVSNTHKPCLNLEHLERYNEGILTLSGGNNGPLGLLLAEQRTREANTLAQRLHKIFPQRFYIELNRFTEAKENKNIQPSRIAEEAVARERRIEEGLLNICRKMSLPPVATNNCMFANQNLYEAHDVLLAIADGVQVASGERRRAMPAQELTSPAKMRTLFKDIPEACENTIHIAERCNKIFEQRKPLLPRFATSHGESEAQVLQQKAEKGLADIFIKNLNLQEEDEQRKIYQKRLALELNVIIEKGLQGYFLIVADFISWAKEKGIPVGPGRGSGAGSLVAWALGITALNPVRWGLLFERFLNPERMSMPDFDIDFCQERREQVIAYVREKYGKDKVGQIITFGTLQARAAVRDVGRTLGIPYPRVDQLCKTIPALCSLKDALKEASSPLARAKKEDKQIAKLLDLSLQLEGLYRHASTHAAGIVIGDRPLVELVPLYRDKINDANSTQFTMKYVEQAGLIKFDFLGLKALSVMAHCKNLLDERGIEMDLDNLELDCPKVYDLFSRADTFGVFQFESSGIRDVLKRMRPDRFEDIIAAVALYRPGPMEQIPNYIARKHGEQKIVYLHEKLQPILQETYGIPVYQEQVICMAQVLAGFSLGTSDHLRRAMGKKDPVEMSAQRKDFIEGCHKNNIDSRLAKKIFEHIYAFAGYGFNKSHAAAYAMIAYQTAWLRVHHPAIFFTSMMFFDADNTDRLAQYIPCLQALGIKLLPPAINQSQVGFALEKHNGKDAIRYGLGALKNVGPAAMHALVAEREKNGNYRDLFDLAERLTVQNATITRRAIEALVRSGALDELNSNRAQSIETIDLLLYIMQSRRANEQTQDSLFGKSDEGAIAPRILPETPRWQREQEMREEREAIGFYISGHPLAEYLKISREQELRNAATIENLRGGERFRILGLVEGIRQKRLKQKNPNDAPLNLMLLSLSDPSGFFEATIFDKQAQRYPFLQVGAAVIMELDCVYIEARDSLQMRVVKLKPLEKFTAQLAKADEANKKNPSKKNLSKKDGSQKRAIANGASQNAISENALSQNGVSGYPIPAITDSPPHPPQQPSSREILQLFVGSATANGWKPQTLAELLEKHARAGSGRIELHIREEARTIRVSLAQNYRLDEALERALKGLDGVDRVERCAATIDG